MEKSNTTKQERYVAASGYLFELGYMISWLTQIDSEFTKFHFEQENKIIKMVIIPGIAILFAGMLWESAVSKFLIYVGALIILVSFVLSIKGARHALNGEKKKVV